MRFKWKPRPRVAVELGALRRIPKELVDVDRVRDELTIWNPAFQQARNMGLGKQKGVEPRLLLFREGETHIGVPRHYEVELADEAAVVDRRWDGCGEPWWVEHGIDLRDEVQAEASAALSRNNGDKIISLACGKGKTVVSLHAAVTGERFPLLVVVHTNALMDQWRERILQFYDLPPEKIGHIQGGVFDWQGKPVAIAMLHSLVLKKYPKEFYRHWRAIVFDEVHKLGAQSFLKAASLFPGERWGLSATVKREDGMDRAFQLHLGKVAYKFLEQPLKPRVFFIDTGMSVDLGKFILWGGRVNMGRLQTHLSENDQRNALIMYWLVRAISKGRTVLVLGERLAQLYEFTAFLKAAGADAAIHVGAMGKEERADALTHQVVLATQQIAKEGLDRPAFDTLFLLATHGGEGRLQQEIGRILRIDDAKKEPWVFVFEDRISIMKALGNRMRKTLHHHLEFEVSTIARKENDADYAKRTRALIRSL